MIFLAYFLTMLSSPKMKSDLLTVKQFSRTGMGLYKAIVRARCALVCLKAGETPPVDTAVPSRVRLRSDPPSPELNRAGTSSPNLAILSEANHTGGDRVRRERRWRTLCSPGEQGAVRRGAARRGAVRLRSVRARHASRSGPVLVHRHFSWPKKNTENF